jgi:hypothetical protein
MNRIFFLSPAYAGGQRAQMIMSERAQFDLAAPLAGSDDPPTLGEVFTFLSGLYFRGKLAYAKASARRVRHHAEPRPAAGRRGDRVAELRAFAEVDIDEDDPRYRKPLVRDVKKLCRQLRRKRRW